MLPWLELLADQLIEKIEMREFVQIMLNKCVRH